VLYPQNDGRIVTIDSAKSLSKAKGSPYSITERRVPELIPVLGNQPAGDVSHKPGGRLSLLSARPAVTPAALKRATNFAAWPSHFSLCISAAYSCRCCAHCERRGSPVCLFVYMCVCVAHTGKGKVKVKFSHTRYRALGPELIPVYRQSARR